MDAQSCAIAFFVLLLQLFSSSSSHGHKIHDTNSSSSVISDKIIPAEPPIPSSNQTRPSAICFFFCNKKIHVTVYNNLGDGIDLYMHCKSRDDDFGLHVVYNTEFFSWKFRLNIFATTLYFCGMSWGDKRGIYEIYNADRDYSRCRNCIWRVFKDGVRGYNNQGEEEIWFRWVPRPPKMAATLY